MAANHQQRNKDITPSHDAYQPLLFNDWVHFGLGAAHFLGQISDTFIG